MKVRGAISLGLVAGKGPKIAGLIEVDVQEPGDKNNPWKGSLTLPPGNALDVGQMYLLKLDDGRSGYLSVTGTRPQPDGTTRFEFQGTSPLQPQQP